MTDKIIINSDGAARGNPGPAGVGGLIIDESGSILIKISEYVGEQTNNIAEYMALLISLEKALNFNPKRLVIYADSELMVRQLNGNYKVKNSGLIPLYKRIMSLLQNIAAVEIAYIPREENKEADKLANEAIDDFLSGNKEIFKIMDNGEQATLF